MLREPTVLVLGFRIDSRSSLSPAPSATPLGLRLGWVDPGAAGPQKSECRLWRWYVEALRCALWPEEEDCAPEEEEEVECLLVPLAMAPALGRIRARLKLLLDRDSVASVSLFRPSSRYVAVISLYFRLASASLISSLLNPIPIITSMRLVSLKFSTGSKWGFSSSPS